MTAIMSSRMASENEGSSCRKKGREGKRMSTMRRSQKGEKGREKKRKGLPQTLQKQRLSICVPIREEVARFVAMRKAPKTEARREGRKEGLSQHTAETTSRSAFQSKKKWPALWPCEKQQKQRQGGREGRRVTHLKTLQKQRLNLRSDQKKSDQLGRHM